jgi:hypothetical protein
MIRALALALALGTPARLITWDGLDHYLEDADARTKMLAESHRFLQTHLR